MVYFKNKFESKNIIIKQEFELKNMQIRGSDAEATELMFTLEPNQGKLVIIDIIERD